MILPSLSGFSLRQLGFSVPNRSSIGAALIGALVMIVIVQGSANIIEHLSKAHHEQDAIRLLRKVHGGAGYLLFALTAVVIAPLVEELTFRVFIFNAVLRRAPFLVAAVCSGALFAAAHADLYALAPLTLGGVVLAQVYYRTRNAWCSMITHAIFNGATVAAVFAAKSALK
jgi:membrane protease YdiL (CAAX protease family)